MKKIVIIGCGFAGLSAGKILCRQRKDLEVTMVDRGEYFNFLPMLPDSLGRGINPEFLTYPIERLSKKYGFRFLQAEVRSVDLAEKKVLASQGDLSYDYLLIASGSETNFYGNENIRKNAYKLDNVDDVRIIKKALAQKDFDNLVIAGAGYTGIEVATNLRRYFERKSQNKRIIIIERVPSILGLLPQWMKDYVNDNLKRLNIEVLVNAGIERIEEDKIYLAGGDTISDAKLIWTAGVRAADFIQNLKVEKNPQGRIKVDAHLRLNESCFVVGDAAYFEQRASFLRMAVQFSLFEGRAVARNILRLIKNKPIRAYRPIDLGYIIPLANNRSCGIILGINMRGRLPTFLHYCMCVYRSYGLRNKAGILRGLLTGG